MIVKSYCLHSNGCFEEKFMRVLVENIDLGTAYNNVE